MTARAVLILLFVLEVFIAIEAQSLPTNYHVPSCGNFRVRREWANMPDQEKQKFVDGFTRLATENTIPSLNDFKWFYGTLLGNLDINDGNSLLLHKVLLLQLEDTLRVRLSDPSFALPYGNWEPYFSNPTNFEQQDFGGEGNFALNGSIFSGLMYYDLTRDYANPIKKVNEEDYRKAVGARKFSKFNRLITHGLQSIINDNYGGSMIATDRLDNAVSDPLWILHQVNIQRIFQTWQLQNPRVSYPDDDLDDMLPGYDSISSRSVWSPSVGCVIYDPPSYSPLQQILNGATVLFGLPFGDLNSFWGAGTRKKKQVYPAECSTFNQLTQTAERGYGLTLLFRLYQISSSTPNYYLKKYFDSVTKTINNFDPNGDYLAQIRSKIDFGIGFDYALIFAMGLQQYDQYCHVGTKFGAKYKPGDDGFLLSKVLIELQYSSDLRSFVEQFADIYTKASHSESPGDIPTQSDLQDLGKELLIRLLKVVSPATPLNNPLNITADSEWECPQGWFGSGDGCDNNCGAIDPDCVVASDFVSPVPIFGCWDVNQPQSVSGECIAGLFPPPEWTCKPEKYAATDGCDCDCGVHDPDCDLVYSGNYAQIAPYLNEINGCYGGKGEFCSDGVCEYETVVPSGWICATDIYSDGVTCDCSCGAYDPDCDNSTTEVIGCGCSEQKCHNQHGLCEGQCGGVSVQVITIASPTGSTTTPSSSPSSSSSPTSSPSPICPKTTGGATVNEAFLNLLNFQIP